MPNLSAYFYRKASLPMDSSLLVFAFLLLTSSFSTASSSAEVDTPNQLSAISEKVIEEFLDNANKSLTDGNTTNALSDLFTVNRMLGEFNVNSSFVDESNLIREAMHAVLNGDTNMALINIDKVSQQVHSKIQNASRTPNATIDHSEKAPTLVQSSLPDNITQIPNATIDHSEKAPTLVQSSLPDNKTSKTLGDTIRSSSIYTNPIFGIKMIYPENWSVKNFVYYNTSNNTIVAFFSPPKAGSQISNVSEMSSQFIPYLDIFVFDPKNISLAKIIENRINMIKNHDYFAIDESKEFSPKENMLAYLLVYSTTIGKEDLFKKLQLYTVFKDKVYLITFTSQENQFTSYLPIVLEMIKSLELQ
jgi:hypothetical protein